MLERYDTRWNADRRLRHLHQIQDAARHMNELLEDILTIGRAQAERDAFHPALLDLEGFCRDRSSDATVKAGRSCHPVLRSHNLDGPVYVDEKHLRHILGNLLNNAIKYSPEGQSVRLSVERAAGQLRFEVADQGIGIPEADQGRLFQAFQRASNVGTISGTGLGLAIVKRSIELHHGTISMTSVQGYGTTFTVILPIDQEPGKQDRGSQDSGDQT